MQALCRNGVRSQLATRRLYHAVLISSRVHECSMSWLRCGVPAWPPTLQTQLEIDRALEQDATVFEYDAVYDEIQQQKPAVKKATEKAVRDRKACSPSALNARASQSLLFMMTSYLRRVARRLRPSLPLATRW